MKPAALIFSHSISPRLQYVVDFLSLYYGHSFKLVYDPEKYSSSDEPCKINYGYQRLSENEIFIHSHALLFESTIRVVKIECFQKNNFKAFFKTEGEVGFDLFASIFYLLSRYEEYLPHRQDVYGRYAHQNAVAFKENFLHIPLINVWLEDFRNLLAERNTAFMIPHSKFSFLPTYDIDMAWSFRNKGFKRNFGGVLLLLLKAQFGKAAYRIKVWRQKTEDPYDAYNWLNELHRQYDLRPIYFFLAARTTGKYDKNIAVSHPEFRQLVESISSQFSIGLHPSWASGDIPSLLTWEKSTLEHISGQPITASRQHYIRLDVPSTYRKLIALGITHDHSMGYGSINGFRASVATPFYWYDLKNEEATKLLLHPFCFMDANAYYEQGLSADAALLELIQFYEAIRTVNGTMITIWHNSFLGTAKEFSGWRQAYARFVSIVDNDKNDSRTQAKV